MRDIFVRFLSNLDFTGRFSWKSALSNFTQICSVGADLIHAARQTWRSQKPFIANVRTLLKRLKLLQKVRYSQVAIVEPQQWMDRRYISNVLVTTDVFSFAGAATTGVSCCSASTDVSCCSASTGVSCCSATTGVSCCSTTTGVSCCSVKLN